MNDAYRTLLTYIANNDLNRARDVAKVILRGSKTAKDTEFCEKLLQKMGEQDEKGLEIPFNLKSIIQTSCTAYDFHPERYFLTEREKPVLEHIKCMHATGERLADRGIHYPNATLLYGESGTGKTTFAQYVANELGLPFLYISLTQVIDSLLGKTGQNMELVFRFISSVPCVAVIDEIDAIGTKRKEDGGVSGELKRVLISVMENLDRLPNSVVLIAATNRPDTLDDALMRRFRVKHEVTRLSKEEGSAMIAQYMREVGLDYTGDVNMFLATTVSVKQSGMPFEQTYTPAAIADALNEQIAAIFSASDEDYPIIALDATSPDTAEPEKKVEINPGNASGIPEKYRWHGNTRTRSPIEKLLSSIGLSEFSCPCCGKKALRLAKQEGSYGELEYWVSCDQCNWDCNLSVKYDCGEVVDQFRTWYAAWLMLDAPEDRLNQNLLTEFDDPEEKHYA